MARGWENTDPAPGAGLLIHIVGFDGVLWPEQYGAGGCGGCGCNAGTFEVDISEELSGVTLTPIFSQGCRVAQYFLASPDVTTQTYWPGEKEAPNRNIEFARLIKMSLWKQAPYSCIHESRRHLDILGVLR